MYSVESGRSLIAGLRLGVYDVLKKLPAGIFVDVGAASGGITQRVLNANPGTQVVAFEPFPANIKFFKETIGDDPWVQLIEAAAGKETGVAEFLVGPTVTGAEPGWADRVGYSSGGRLAAEAEPGQLAKRSKITVKVVRIDDVIDDRIQLMKIDVQGDELSVLTGAEKLLKARNIDLVYCEYSGQPGLVEYMAHNDFQAFDTEYIIVPRDENADVPDWEIVGTKNLSSGRKAYQAWPKAIRYDLDTYAKFLREARGPKFIAMQTDLLFVRKGFSERFRKAAAEAKARSDPYVNQPVRAPRAGALLERWQEIERGFSRADRTAYRHAWGMAREDFCTKYGVPLISEADVQRLRELKGSYAGRRIFIVGNGPSINKMPLHLLKDEFTFGVNRIYLLFDRIRWKPSFYTANDWRVVPDIADEISALSGMTFFFDQKFRGLLREGSDVYWYQHRSAPQGSTPLGRGFSSDLTIGARGAGSVVGTAVQIAFYLGFDPIYLIGCDLGYTVPATVIQEGEDKFGTGVKLRLTSTKDDDPNHFDPRYFGMGKRWHDPNVKRMIEGHIQCRRAIDAAGRRIFNATLGGQLEVYERVDFLSLFDSARNEPALSPTKQADGWQKGLRWPQVKVARYSLYYRVASYLQRNHPSIARVGRFALWSLRAIRRRLFGAGGVFLLAVTGLLLASLLVERHSALLAGVCIYWNSGIF